MLILQSLSARVCHHTYGNLPCRLMCHQLSLDTVCDRAVRPPALPGKGPPVLVRPHWHRLQAMFCARDVLAHVLTLLRSIVLLHQDCLAAPHHHELPKDSESTPRLHATCAPRSIGHTFPGALQTRRRTAGGRPDRARRPARSKAASAPLRPAHTVPLRPPAASSLPQSAQTLNECLYVSVCKENIEKWGSDSEEAVGPKLTPV